MRRNHNYYRRLYESYHGRIPKDEYGRSYDIHHIDGDSSNNSKENLIALSIRDHYAVHFQQKDWGACWSISLRMKISPEERSEISRRIALERVKNGTNYFSSKENSDRMRSIQKEKVISGAHVFLDSNKKDKHPQYDHTIRQWRNKITGEIVCMTNYELRTTYNLKSGAVSRVVNNKNLKSTGGWELIKSD